MQLRIVEWFESEVEKVKHHELHKKNFKRSFIMKLQTEQALLEGQDACAHYLQKSVEDLLLHPALLDPVVQNILLEELYEQFTEADNKMLVEVPTKSKVEESVKTSNVHAAPGSDGITSLVYSECFHRLGDALTEVSKVVLAGNQPSKSQRTSLMLFSSKPAKS